MLLGLGVAGLVLVAVLVILVCVVLSTSSGGGYGGCNFVNWFYMRVVNILLIMIESPTLFI